MILNLDKAIKKNRDRGYEKLYWCIDLHDVIIPGTYTRNNEDRELYSYAKEVLQFLTAREDMVLILWTSSHKEPVDDILKWLETFGIKFNYVNENPECPTTELADFSKKFYFEVLIDDKAGWNGETDWKILGFELNKFYETFSVQT